MNFLADALGFTLANEGGFVSDPDDSGGATNAGITLADWSTFIERPASLAELKALSDADKWGFYRARFWRPLGLYSVGQRSIALCVFDAGVLFGVGTAARIAQATLVTTGYPAVEIDGHVGTNTLAALNAVEPELFVPAFQANLNAHIEKIVADNPRDAKFEQGWKNRVAKYALLTKGGTVQ